MAAACSCIQSVLLLIHHPHLCCQLGNCVHFCTWNQGKAMRNYFPPQKFNCLQREHEKLHFDLSLISIWAVGDHLRSPSINCQFIWRDYFFFSGSRGTAQSGGTPWLMEHHTASGIFFFTAIAKHGPHTCCFPLCHTWTCAFLPDSWPKGWIQLRTGLTNITNHSTKACL